MSVRDQHGQQRSLRLSHETELLVRDAERTDARANLDIQRESMSDADPIRPAQSPWFVVMNSTCSGASPAIVENCMDPETGEAWERQIAKLPTTHVEREDMHAVGPVGTFNTHPERFEQYRDSDFEPEEVFSIASTMAAAPVMLGAIEAVLRSFAYATGAGPEWFEACRAAHALATTPYVPTPDPSRD